MGVKEEIASLVNNLGGEPSNLTDGAKEILKATFKTLINMQAVVARMENMLEIGEELQSDVKSALEDSDLMKVRKLLSSPVGKDFDFNVARNARKEMFVEINNASDAKTILEAALKFALTIAPML
ncbi:MAG: hypothetical protein Q8P40_08455 [Nitrospirota bacterium]|nr:hypothetical protein [Nitrospirota bacterium]